MKAWSQAGQADFYEVLGVSRWADKEDIKQRFFFLAKKYHPDVNDDDIDAHKTFANVSEAYKVRLSYSRRRASRH